MPRRKEGVAAPVLEIDLFGPMQVRIQGQPVRSLRAGKLGLLLAFLILHHDRAVDRERLAATLWPDSEREAGLATLRARLGKLRRALGSQRTRLKSPDKETLILELESPDVVVDILAFDVRVERSDLSALEEAVAWYEGPLLEGCNEEWAFEERMARELRCLQALQKLGDAAVADQDYERALDHYDMP